VAIAACETARRTLGDGRTERGIWLSLWTPGPAAVDVVDWTGLAPGTRYLGGVSYRKKPGALTSDNLPDFTVVGIDTR
jgi:hypothetical protein